MAESDSLGVDVTPLQAYGRGRIAAALAKIQGELTNLVKDREVTVTSQSGKSFSYSYATLATALAEIRPIFSKYEVAIVQAPRIEQGYAFVMTEFIHSSGESVGCELGLPFTGTAQAAGSAISYARRYGLFSLAGIAADDDDDDAVAADKKSAVVTPKDVPPAATDSRRFMELARRAVTEGKLSGDAIATKAALVETLALLFHVPVSMFDPKKMDKAKWDEAYDRLAAQTGLTP